MVMDATGQIMSKSKGNVVSPIDMMKAHGVDPTRVAMFFSSPGDKEVLWSETGVVGAERFLLRVDQFVRHAKAATGESFDPDARFDTGSLSPQERDVYRKLHQTIRKVDRDFEVMQLNTHISAIMELSGELGSGEQLRPALRAVCAATMVKLLAPLTPHMSEEWWEILGFGPTVFRAKWPAVDEAALPTDNVTLAVQINGKLRGQVTVPADADENTVVAAVQSDPKLNAHLAGKTVVKTIYVPGRLLNIVVK
jgi:leucyl-tRNA synthetase